MGRISAKDKIPAIKYLGVYFDPHLNFKYHLSQISQKVSRALFILRSVKNFLPPPALKTLYYSLIHCHLVYAAEIWGCVPTSSLNALYIKQKSAIRIISNKNYNDHTEPLFKLNEILPLPLLVEMLKTKFFHSYHFNFLPIALANTWTLNSLRQHEHAHLRNEDDYFIPFARTDHANMLPLSNLPRLWNSLPFDIKVVRNRNTFTAKLKKFYFDSLSPTPNCTRLLCPVCHLK